MMFVSVGVLLVALIPLVTGSEWDYGHHHGPSAWPSEYPICRGFAQSPINLDHDAAVLDKSLGNFAFGGHYCGEGFDKLTYNLINNGHSLKLSFGGSPHFTLTGGGLPGTWALQQLHIHWGSSDCVGSEHTVDGDAFPGEVHFVHYNTAYKDFAEALNHPDGLAVLGFMLEIDDYTINPGMTALVNAISSVPYAGDTTTIRPFSVCCMLPDDDDMCSFFRYKGSLTTPPCFEIVNWTVFNDARIKITSQQMHVLRTALSSHDNTHSKTPIVNNYRPVMPLYGRKVHVSG